MEIKHLKAFLTIVEEGSINRAAQTLHIAQPPLSRQIKALEEELGVKLFIRGTKEIQLTEEGHLLMSRSKEIMELVGNTCQEISNFSINNVGVLNIGFVSSIGTSVIPEVISNFRLTYPKVQFRLWEGGSLRIIELVDKGIVDVGFIRPPFQDDKYHMLSKTSESLCAIFNKHYFDLPGFETVCISTIKDLPILSIPRYSSIIENAFSKLNITPNIICQSDTIFPSVALAKVGLGLAIVPFSSYKSILEYEAIQPLFFNDASFYTEQIIIWKKKHYLSSICRAFIDSLEKN